MLARHDPYINYLVYLQVRHFPTPTYNRISGHKNKYEHMDLPLVVPRPPRCIPAKETCGSYSLHR